MKTSIVWLLALLLGGCSLAACAEPAPSAGQRSERSAEKAAQAAAALERSAPPQSFLGWLGHALGVRWVAIFLVLTVNLLAVVVMNVLAVGHAHVVPPALIQGLETRIDNERYQEACDLAKRDPSLLGQVLAAGMAEISDGYAAAAAAMQEATQLLTLKMRQRLGYLMLIATLAVLLGAAGTFSCMSGAFEAAGQEAGQPGLRQSQLFLELASAMVAVMIGVWIAVAAILAHHVLRNRMNELTAEVGILSERLLKRLAAAKGA